MKKLRWLAVALTILALLTVLVTPALAHALLARSLPEANAALDRAPAQIELFFTETLEPSFSTITVFNSSAAQVDNGDSKLDPADHTHLTVSLRSLPDGVYTVAWKALSAVDGHVTTGSFRSPSGTWTPRPCKQRRRRAGRSNCQWAKSPQGG
jgi:methionine-rich copper-binding protein CopC